MNSDKSWIMNYGSSLRKKKKNFDNVRFESSKPTWNSTSKVKPARVLRTVASAMRVTPGLIEMQKRQQQRRQQQSCVNTSENEV